jgi:hypothetical protein
MERILARLAVRFACALILGVFLQPRAFAQTPADGDWQVISSPEGYQLQVPPDWYPRSIDVGGTVATEVESPDGSNLVFVAVAQIPLDRNDNPSELLQDFVMGQNISQRAHGGSEVNVFQGPFPIHVVGADFGYGQVQVSSNMRGSKTFEAVHLATKGSVAFLIDVGGQRDSTHPDPILLGSLTHFR